MKEFNPCPICGRHPKIYYYGVNTAIARCKPFFGKKHLSVNIEYEQPSNLDDKLIKTWNAAVQKKQSLI